MSLSNILHSPITYVIIFFLILIFIQVIFYFILGFENIITIKDKYVVSGNKSGIFYYIVDNNNSIYKVENVWFLGDFNKAEDYNSINKGDTYKVKGYGFRNDMLSIYPTIYNITKN